MTKRPVGMDRHEIKAEVHRRGGTLGGIASAAGLDESACRAALIRRHLAGERALADYLGLAPEAVWPERYAKPSPWAKRKLAEGVPASLKRGRRTDTGVAA
ncbi:helix-turn-helix domain-containing protein [Xanthobacter sp. KR7-225]|uniref:helix-turn-helix domain-containing protein n=1 Tax=Xanthobacter sp. KR7-225 TaxID=3156613 RepID=UPI0032B585CD